MAGGAKGHVRRHRHGVGKKPSLDAVRNDINVTPLVDVVLVLLIIFMVVTPLMARGHEVPLPKTRNHSSKKDAHQPVIAIDANGDVFFDKEKLGPLTPAITERLRTNVQRAWDERPETTGMIYVKAANNLAYGKIYPLLLSINEDLGVSSIDLATAEAKE
jgi:biopolymer transport protein ExbD